MLSFFFLGCLRSTRPFDPLLPLYYPPVFLNAPSPIYCDTFLFLCNGTLVAPTPFAQGSFLQENASPFSHISRMLANGQTGFVNGPSPPLFLTLGSSHLPVVPQFFSPMRLFYRLVRSFKAILCTRLAFPFFFCNANHVTLQHPGTP